MKIFDKNSFRIQIKPSFLAVMLIMIALDYAGQFFILFLSVTIHESAHMILAFIFKCKTNKLIITPIGETAVIKELNKLCLIKRLLVTIIGPLTNIIIFIIFLPFSSDIIDSIKYINLALALFNLLPIYPLDGGRLILSLLGYNIGVLNANNIMIKISRIFSIILIILGIVQMILFSYNISLLCIGIYLIKLNKKEHLKLMYEFYKFIINRKQHGIIPVKILLVDKTLNIKKIIFKFCFDYYLILYIYDNGKVIKSLPEKTIINYIQLKGLNGTIDDIFETL